SEAVRRASFVTRRLDNPLVTDSKGTGSFDAAGGPRVRFPAMPRRARSAAGGVVYHVLNRANARATLFHKDGDYTAFHRVLAEAHARCPTRLLAWCVMPNHWHFVLWP